ncbi:MAG: L-fucose isomerase-like protein [Ignavibacteria bacterium]|nr:MAG: L-fucose isomerase-like protein [Ignavibacteria bacterium]KAF0158999.1 MAG: L-fucose isomerase-like protein [Ignavibacteria bacterium]
MSNIKFGFIPVASSILSTTVEQVAQESWKQLGYIGGERFSAERINENLPIIFFVLTGGTEQQVLELCLQRKNFFTNEPVILAAHPTHNSLPSSLEILARLQQIGAKGKIIYLDEISNKDCIDDLKKEIKHISIYHKLRNVKVGLVGEPSDWLVASSPEIERIKNVWGPEVVKISLGELKQTIADTKDEEVENEHFAFTKKAAEVREPSKKEVKQVVRVYGALKKLIKKYELNAVSVRCFDLVLDLNTTGCFALSKLNDDGIIAGCEGDLVSTLGMIWANLITDQSVWMANPAQLDEHNNTVLFAHCTVPVNMIQTYKLRSHFESGLGVGIQGEFTKGKVTMLRLGGNNLEKMWITNGEIIESGSDENLCRTQVNVKLQGSSKPSDLLNNPLGNHVLLLRGNYVKEMLSWWKEFIER